MRHQDTNAVLKFSHLGIVFALILGGSLFLGLELDERLESSPLGALLGVLLGFGAGFYHLYQGVYGRGGVVEDSEQDVREGADSDEDEGGGPWKRPEPPPPPW